MQKRRFVRDDRQNCVAQTRDTALHDGACAQLLKFPSEMALGFVLRVRVPARQLGVCESSCQPFDECEDSCRRAPGGPLTLRGQSKHLTAIQIAAGAKPRCIAGRSDASFHLVFNKCLTHILAKAARSRTQSHSHMLLSRLASRGAASGTRALLARASQRSAQRAPRRLLSEKPAEKAAEKAAAPEAKPGWWSTVWNQISGAPRHRRDVDNLTHWSISTQVEQRRVLGRPRRARGLGHDRSGDL